MPTTDTCNTRQTYRRPLISTNHVSRPRPGPNKSRDQPNGSVAENWREPSSRIVVDTEKTQDKKEDILVKQDEDVLIPADFFTVNSLGCGSNVINSSKPAVEVYTPCYCPAVCPPVATVKKLEIDENSVQPTSQLTVTQLDGLRGKIQNAQQSDQILQAVQGWLNSGIKPISIQAHRAPKELISYWRDYELLSIKDGIVYRKWISMSKNQETPDRDLLCIPESMHVEILDLCHKSLTANHPGITNTLTACRQYFHWPGLRKDVELYVNACNVCATTKPPRSFLKTQRQHIIAHKFNDIVLIDHIEPEKLGLTQMGNKYILSIRCLVWIRCCCSY